MNTFRLMLAAGVLLILAAILIIYPRSQGVEPASGSPVVGDSPSPAAVSEALSMDRSPSTEVREPEEKRVVGKFLVLEAGTEAPIENAHLFLDADNRNQWLGSTDSAGGLVAALPDAESFVFRATESTHSSAIAQVTGEFLDEVVLYLAPGGSIRGTVRDQDGRSVGPGATVSAWSVDESLNRADIEAWLATGRSAGRFATTDELGEFLITGLNASGSFILCAGHRGALSNIQVAAPSAVPVDITVLPLYGLLARVRTDQSSIPVQTAPSLGIVFSTSAGVGGRPIFPGDPRLLLSGFSPDGLVQDSRYDLLYLTSTATPEAALPPIGLSVRIPGYEYCRQELHLSRCEQGLKEYAVLLTPTTRDWCNLTIHFLGAQQPVDSTSQPGLLLATFFLMDSSGKVHEYQLQDFTPSLSFPGIPYGTYSYQVKLNSGFGAGNYAEGTLVLDSSVSALEIDVSKLASALIKINSSNGSPFIGRARIKVTRQLDGRSTTLSYQAYPYVVKGLPSDSAYVVEVERPRPGEGRKHSTAEFSVSPTQIATVVLELDIPGER